MVIRTAIQRWLWQKPWLSTSKGWQWWQCGVDGWQSMLHCAEHATISVPYWANTPSELVSMKGEAVGLRQSGELVEQIITINIQQCWTRGWQRHDEQGCPLYIGHANVILMLPIWRILNGAITVFDISSSFSNFCFPVCMLQRFTDHVVLHMCYCSY